MADVSVNGWIAEGGHTITEGKKNNIILFDVVEDVVPINGIDDVYNNNNAWFHCSFEISWKVLFRSYKAMPEIERKTLEMATGRTLDVGAASLSFTCPSEERHRCNCNRHFSVGR